MAIIIEEGTKKNFVNYALPINRVDLETGERLEAQHFRLRYPFKRTPVDASVGLGRTIQGAANGSEAILQS